MMFAALRVRMIPTGSENSRSKRVHQANRVPPFARYIPPASVILPAGPRIKTSRLGWTGLPSRLMASPKQARLVGDAPLRQHAQLAFVCAIAGTIVAFLRRGISVAAMDVVELCRRRPALRYPEYLGCGLADSRHGPPCASRHPVRWRALPLNPGKIRQCQSYVEFDRAAY